MRPVPPEQHEAAYAILEAAGADLAALGLEAPACWRFLCWASAQELRASLCDRHAREDLEQIKAIIDRFITELEPTA